MKKYNKRFNLLKILTIIRKFITIFNNTFNLRKFIIIF